MIQIIIGFLIFTFLAIGGLIVDLGFARLTHRQMVNATDAAALEGMRLKDSASEEARRQASRSVLSAHYDDGFGTGRAGAVVDETNPLYEPALQLNLPNARFGDLVAGRFDPADLAHLETGAYERSDFDETGATPGWDAFLVRVRRTDGSRSVDAVPGVSSRGPSLPYLFGRGSLMDRDASARGITVRATSIAAGRRATMVGPDDPTRGITGAGPILLDLQFWNALSAGSTATLRFGRDGTLPGSGGRSRPPGGPPMPNPIRPPSGPPGGPPIIPPGQITGGTGEPRGVFANRVEEERKSWSIGDAVWPAANLSIAQAFAWLGHPEADDFESRILYIPIYDGVIDWDGRPGNSNPPFLPPVENRRKGEGPARIVGFGAVLLLEAGRGDDDDDDGAEIRIRKLSSRVAPLNVSAVSTPGLAETFATTILQRHREVDDPLRGAAIVR